MARGDISIAKVTECFVLKQVEILQTQKPQIPSTFLHECILKLLFIQLCCFSSKLSCFSHLFPFSPNSVFIFTSRDISYLPAKCQVVKPVGQRWCDQPSLAGVPLCEGLLVKPKGTDASFECCEDASVLHRCFFWEENKILELVRASLAT